MVKKFVEDIMLNTKLISLPLELYEDVINARKSLNLDFDDAYQYSVAKHYGLKIVTMDRDFEKVRDVEVQFL
ncbi:type II toxin-antitoxin system VapC family toxin [Geoglobus ahangari]|uniref:type II toxin-antitoxin system VapC family toxin n=1 Tax=Geoglobus ahangari TaxID=113653 RepID=UPI001C54C612|nr:PIN domain-containing protein [Geoglobus ahangari]